MNKSLQNFVSLEAASGLLLVFVLLITIVIANSPLAHFYQAIIDMPVQVRIGQLDVHKSALLWINEGLMSVFFMLLALEMKREIVSGELSKPAQLILPISCAIAGIAFPVAVYFIFNWQTPQTWAGWPIGTTTDIAFALGLLAILSRYVPTSLKIFLVALSIVDDLLAVSIIAIFYTDELTILSLGLAFLGLIALAMLNIKGVTRLAPYMLVGVFIWLCVLKSGVHATLAGAAIGAAIPLRAQNERGESPLHALEHMLHPWVAFMILPLFVFANGGILFKGMSVANFMTSVPLGIALSLFMGKTIGVFTTAWGLIKLKIVKMPNNSNWLQLLAISAVTGIGFTMSLFLTALAFYGTEYEELARQGVLLGSLLSAILAVSCFVLAGRSEK